MRLNWIDDVVFDIGWLSLLLPRMKMLMDDDEDNAAVEDGNIQGSE